MFDLSTKLSGLNPRSNGVSLSVLKKTSYLFTQKDFIKLEFIAKICQKKKGACHQCDTRWEESLDKHLFV